jgi:hypothetical protein
MQVASSHLPVSAFAVAHRIGRDAVAVARLFRIVRRSMSILFRNESAFTLRPPCGIVSVFDSVRLAGGVSWIKR